MKKERVLVVDDSPQNRLVAAGHLESGGYEVLAAASGEDALALLAHEKVDLVILDVLMPGLGGFETCRRIRNTPAIADTPVLFLTALGDREATQPAIEAGGDDLLPKPFHRSELMLRARALIRQRKTTAALKQTLRELVEHNEALRRIEHDKRKISELIVHDLKSPLTAVLANAELLKQQAPVEQHEMLDDILTGVHQIDRTAKNLLDLSRAEDAELVVRPERFSMTELVEEVAATMRGLLRWTELELTIDVRCDSVVADRELLRRMLQNLLHNALKHAPEGTAVRVEADVDDDGLLVCVKDQGPGVSAEDVDRIFERYVSLESGSEASPTGRRGHPRAQSPSVDASRTSSHGLGLAFCRLAAEAHGGKVWVEPRTTGGATFCVRIPQPAR